MRNLLILAVAAAFGLPAFAGDCRSVVQSLPVASGASYSYSQTTIVQQTPVIQQTPVYDVAPVASCVPCTSATLALPAYTSGAVYASPAAYLPSMAAVSYRSYAAALPQTYISRSFATPVYHRTASLGFGTSAYSFPVNTPRFLGPPIHAAPAFNPGGFRAGFAGQGLNNSGAGFLTGGGLIGGAANALGVSSAGLEGAALGILATRSNLFGLAPKRR